MKDASLDSVGWTVFVAVAAAIVVAELILSPSRLPIIGDDIALRPCQSATNDDMFHRAIVKCAEFIEDDPSSAAAYSYLGRAYHGLGLYFEAIVNYDRAIELDPSDTATIRARDSAYEALQE